MKWWRKRWRAARRRAVLEGRTWSIFLSSRPEQTCLNVKLHMSTALLEDAIDADYVALVASQSAASIVRKVVRERIQNVPQGS